MSADVRDAAPPTPNEAVHLGAFGWFAGSAPAERLAVVRVAVFAFATVYLLARSVSILSVLDLRAARFDPIGPLSPLTGPVPGWVLSGALVVTITACVGAAAGWRYRITAPVAALGLVGVLTYRLSWGQVLHTENLLVTHAMLLAVMPAADAWALDAPPERRRLGHRSAPRWVHGWALQTLALATILGYVIAAWAKIRNGGVDWITGDVLRSHIAYDNLRKDVLGDPSSPFAGLVVPHGWLFPPMAAASMVIEIGALLAIGRGLLRRWWIGLTWAFHVAILALMAILFPYQLLGVAFLPFVAGDDLVRRSWRAFRRRRATTRR